MGARGVNLAQEGHVVPIILPASITGGATSAVFGMRSGTKANILLQFGALAAAPTAVTLLACTDITGATSQAIPFDVYQQVLAGAGNDVFGVRTPVTAAGYVPVNVAGHLDLIEVQDDQLPQGYPYLKLVVGSPAAANFASAVAVLTGLRFAGESNPTATV
jgi:hypothetical protein